MKNVLVALLVAIVLGGGALYLTADRDIDTPAPATGIVNAPDPAPVDTAPYLAAFPLTAPEVPPITGTGAADRALEQALVPLRNGDYAAAATALDGVLLDHPQEMRAQLYLGIARLFQDEPQNALELLRPLEFNSPDEVAAEASWYSLVGIARLRDPSHVEAEAKTLCSAGRRTSARACAALETLSRARDGR